MCTASPPKMKEDKSEQPRQLDAGVQAAREEQRKKARGASGTGSTILTGPLGVQEAPATAKKVLLGS